MRDRRGEHKQPDPTHEQSVSVEFPRYPLDAPANPALPQTSQNVAEAWNLSRREMDEYALVSHQMSEEATNRDQCPIDRRHRLSSNTSQVFAEISHVTYRHSGRVETLPVGSREPMDEFAQVSLDRLDRMATEIIRG